MQRGFGVNFLFWSSEFQENCRRNSQRNLMANFDSDFFGLLFPGFQATQKIHAQNSRPELSAFLSNFTFFNPKFIHGDFLLTGETKIFRSCPPTSEKVPLCGNHQTKRILGQLLRSLLQNPRNFSEVAPEVRPALHTAALRLK